MAELELVEREGIAEESVEEAKKATGKRNPPARNTSRFWFERFLAVIQRQNPSVIDSSFVGQIAPSNEGKLLAQLKFLHVIDEQGKATPLLASLNMVGEEQKKAFQEVMRKAYGDLMSEIMVERALPDDIVNYFIRKYSFTRDKGINAAKFFLYLAEKASIPVSQELASFLNDHGTNGASQTPSTKLVTEKRVPLRESRNYSLAPQRRTESVGQPAIQTVINVRLDKDTPREYWDRILSLIGERRDGQFEVQSETTT